MKRKQDREGGHLNTHDHHHAQPPRYAHVMHVELNRRFRELTKDPTASGSDQAPLHPTQNSCDWDGLLKNYRVVILSEAGAGKTAEIRHITKVLREQGKAAFFLRLENLAQNFDTAFEVGAVQEFDQWMATANEGWLLLDSIDEARLKSPRDFELALNVLTARLSPALQRVHVLLTGRTAAWRPFTDLALCGRKLPYAEPAREQGETSDDGMSQVSRPANTDDRPEGTEQYKLYALENLTEQQVRRYAEARHIQDIEQFLREVERSDGWAFTTRPLDLEDLLKFWQANRRIGSKLELLRDSISRRLKETTQDREELTPLTPVRAREGARRIAAACTMARKQSITVPDGPHGHSGLQVDIVLADWTAAERTALLQRAIFDEEIYGTVRFHHREVREYLTAEWMAEHLQDNLARPSIEALLFRTQYNLLVVNPTTRPVLPWLAHLDRMIQDRAIQLAASTLLNEGDPSLLPLHIRGDALSRRCEALAKGAPRQLSDEDNIQRFAKEDLTAEVRALLALYQDEENQNFLLQIIGRGGLHGALPDVMAIAQAPFTAHYPRIYAIRALETIGSPADRAALRSSYTDLATELDRNVVAELLEQAPKTLETLGWLIRCLEKLPPPAEFSIDNLDSATASFVEALTAEDCAATLVQFCNLLNQKPHVREERCDIAERYVWLLGPSTWAMYTLLKAQHLSCLEKPVLSLLARLPIAEMYDVYSAPSKTPALAPLVQAWPEMTFALLWHLVDRARAQSNPSNRAITDYRHTQAFHSYAQLRPEHFDLAIADIASRPLLDDKLVALSVAIQIFDVGGRLPEHESRLRLGCEGQSPVVIQRLEASLLPPAVTAAMRRANRQDAVRKAKVRLEIAERAAALEESRRQLSINLELIRSPFIPGGRDPIHALSFLYGQLRAIESNSTIWGASKWQSLITKFGSDIAEAYRDGLRHYWRRHRPQLVSEGAALSSTPHTDIIGLGGLYIEYEEKQDWARALSANEIDLAFRYAMRELNGFPKWFQPFYLTASETVRGLLLREIDFELAFPATAGGTNYVINDILWSAPWSWNALGPALLKQLEQREIVDVEKLQALMDIVQGSTLSDEELRIVAQAKCSSVLPMPVLARWFAIWTGVDPAHAIETLQGHCESLGTGAQQTEFFMQYLVALVGSRHGQPARGRRGYEAATHLKSLYLLAHRFIRIDEDIDRVGTGVYSPGLRDDAQDAREILLSTLRTQTGKATFMALTEIALHHPYPAQRPYIQNYARQVAEMDSAGEPWTETQVGEFHRTLVNTPTNPKELLDLAERSLIALQLDLEQGDSSIAPILKTVDQEVKMRNYIAGWLRDRAKGRYSVPQEEEFADAKRADIRFLGQGFDAPIPVELKLVDNIWTGPSLFERLENQLSGDYLRDLRSRNGIFLLVYRGEKKRWELPNSSASVDFDGLVLALRAHGKQLALDQPNIDELRVIGIDLTKRQS